MADAKWDLDGRTVIVTGASSGMGEATALFLGERHANVVLQGRDRGRLDNVAARVIAAGGKAHVVELDLEDAPGARRLVDEAVEAFDDLHGLVLNASVLDALPLEDCTLESVNRQWTTNVLSHLLITQAAAPLMKPGGAIVFVSSTTAHVGFGGYAGYAATKGAVEALSRTLSAELAPAGIRVNTVAPGFVRTPMLTPQLESTPGMEEALNEQTLSGRIGEPEEIASAIGFLLSGLAPYINGATLVIDGGWTAR